MIRFPRARPIVLALALALAGCAEPGLQQLYVPLNRDAGYGYTVGELPDRQAVVSYVAPLDSAFTYRGVSGREAVTSRLSLAFDMALLRAADLAVSKGYPGFRVTNRTNDANVQRYYDPYAYDFGYPHYRRFGVPYYPFGLPYDNSYETLETRVTLDVTFEPKIGKGVYNAAEVARTIRGRYAPAAPPPPAG